MASWVSDCEKGYVSTAEFYWDDSENPKRPHLLQAYRVQEIVVNVSWRERQVLVNASFLMNSNSETCLWIPALMLELDCFRCWLTFSLWRCQSRRCWPSGAPFLSPSLSWYFPAGQLLHLYIVRFESIVLKTHSLAFNIPGIFLSSYSELSSLTLLFTRIRASPCFHILNRISFCHRLHDVAG